MNEEIHCITNNEKNNQEWMGNDEPVFLVVLYSVYKKLGQFFFHTLVANLFKQRYISLLQVINISTS